MTHQQRKTLLIGVAFFIALNFCTFIVV